MQKLNVPLPRFTDKYDGPMMRAFVRVLESTFQKLRYDGTNPITEISANYTIARNDAFLLVDTSAGSVTITLPESSADLIDSRQAVTIKKLVAANTVTVQRSGSDTVDGATSIALSSANSAYTVRAISGGWVTF